MVNPTAAELALINIFIIVLIILEGIIKIGSAKSDPQNQITLSQSESSF
jgi:hypothetical protein